MEKTLNEMLDVFQQFFGVEFRHEAVPGLWHPDAVYVGVYAKDTNRTEYMVGHILLDMYPRPNKYSHGCMECIVPAVRGNDSAYHPPVIIIITNFTQATADRPALFSQEDVFTLFHEFGHAVHGLFGATRMATFAGTNVKLDFVEMPSQMLEEWLYDAAILKKMSGHYLTGEPLSDELIAAMIQIKKFGSGLFARRQVMQGLLSLALFEEGADKKPAEIHKALFEEIMGDYIAYDSANNFHASFGHLAEYGSRYYCYMWSKVYALDMFNHIKKQGLLNNEIGRKYIENVIGKGGSVEPETLLVDFLGRQPDMEAFFEDFGF
jgi:thimet oligopeptidase